MARSTIFRPILTIALLVLNGAGHGSNAAADSGPFAAAIAQTQPRMVKIYGASIGRQLGYATGFLVSADGRVLTADGVHLAASNLRVITADGQVHQATVLKRSGDRQLALLKIDVTAADHFDLKQAAQVEAGDWVVAVSNAFKVADGNEPLAATLGIVSLRTALDAKRGTQQSPYRGEALLLDAITSNPGAAGGVLVTVEGRLAGMIGKTAESRVTGTRLNYALPPDVLTEFVFTEHQRAAPAVAGAGPPRDLGVRLFKLAGSRGPAFVDRVVPGSAAAVAGLQADDLILMLNGRRIASVKQFEQTAASLDASEDVEIVVKRNNKVIKRSLPAAM